MGPSKSDWWPHGDWSHNDPYPLPVPPSLERPVGLARSARRRWMKHSWRRERVREAVGLINQLAAARIRRDGSLSRVQPGGFPPTQVQRSVLDSVSECVLAFGEPPEGVDEL